MSQMQEVHARSADGADATGSATASGLFKSPGALIWRRRDWQDPVGSFATINIEARRAEVRSSWFDWNFIEIPELLLERQAALLLLQGQRLSDLLIPNHEVVDPMGTTHQVAHLILRVDPWKMYQPVPKLTGLVLARLGALPLGVPPTEVLSALVSSSAPTGAFS